MTSIRPLDDDQTQIVDEIINTLLRRIRFNNELTEEDAVAALEEIAYNCQIMIKGVHDDKGYRRR